MLLAFFQLAFNSKEIPLIGVVLGSLLFPQLRLALGVPTSSVQRNWWAGRPGSSTSVPWVAAPFAFTLPLGKLGARVPLWHPPLPLGMLGARVSTRHRQSLSSSLALSLLLARL